MLDFIFKRAETKISFEVVNHNLFYFVILFCSLFISILEFVGEKR